MLMVVNFVLIINILFSIKATSFGLLTDLIGLYSFFFSKKIEYTPRLVSKPQPSCRTMINNNY